MFYVQCDGAHKSRARCHQRHTHTHTESGTHMRLDGSTQIQLWLCGGERGRKSVRKQLQRTWPALVKVTRSVLLPQPLFPICLSAHSPPSALPTLSTASYSSSSCPSPHFDSFWVLSVWNAFCNSYFAWKCQTAKCHKMLKKTTAWGESGRRGRQSIHMSKIHI